MPNALLSKVENENVLVLERVFDAPPARVFEMYTKPEHLKRWWGPRGWELPVCEIDFRPGGTWLYMMKCVDEAQGQFFGMEAWGKAIYKAIDAPKRIDYTDYFCDSQGVVNEALPSTDVTVEFREEGGKTRLVSRGVYASAEALQTVMNMGMLEGITQTWDRLEESLGTAS